MKKIFTLIFITLLGSVFAYSQAETKTPVDWQVFAPVNESFSIEIPVALDKSLSKNTDSDQDASRRYLNSFEGTYFFIFSDGPKKPVNLEFVQKFVKFYDDSAASEKIGEFDVEKYAFSDSMDFYHTVLIAKGKNRSYVIQTVSPLMEDPSVERFFNSLKLENKTVAEKTVEQNANKDINITVPTYETENKQVTQDGGRGSGYGRGDGSGYQTTSETKPTPATTPTKITAGVKILSKPRANYTDFARFYEMTGKVTLRVTFSASGTIGAVIPINKLPFGLTEQAIAAARGITFEPAMREGVPYSVVKPVEYSFIIY